MLTQNNNFWDKVIPLTEVFLVALAWIFPDPLNKLHPAILQWILPSIVIVLYILWIGRFSYRQWSDNNSGNTLDRWQRLKLVWHPTLATALCALVLFGTRTSPVIFLSSSSSNSSEITVTTVKFQSPHIFEVAGTYKNLPDDTDFHLYVEIANGNRFLKDVTIHEGGLWESSDPIKVGDEERPGGAYEIGVVFTDRETCSPLLDKEVLSENEWPSCAQTSKWIDLTREVPAQ